MKKLFFILQPVLFIAFNFSLLMAGYQLMEAAGSKNKISDSDPRYNDKEDFDPSLLRLTSMEKLTAYCDSLYEEKANAGGPVKFEEDYTNIAASVIRKRFYHGYSYYGLDNNFLGVLIADVSIRGLRAIVIPDDMLKYPYAACSQQSVILMKIFQQKGFTTRKVGFQGKKDGHFCFETDYEGSWHFFDPDMEPDIAIMNAYHRPSIQFLAHHPDILLKAYKQFPAEKVLDVFPNYFYGPLNTIPGTNAIIFQKATKALSYFIWAIFLLLFVMARRKYLRLSNQYVRNRRVSILNLQQGRSLQDYPLYTAQGA
ncbi:MAG TPA: hypothetical protein VKC90_06405 [Chitinophagaceae bacterium]|nr:hypothetical protein [Chitinophagaceae bacterium]